MNKIRVSKDKVIKILKENLEKNEKLYLDSLSGYQNKAMAELRAAHDHVEAGNIVEYSSLVDTFDPPYDPSVNYRRVIGMLEMDMDHEVELTTNEYQKYIEDDWDWKDKFFASNMKYSR